jgi:glutamate/tyrosine decarboxylase-like PLP-dependent enzyme
VSNDNAAHLRGIAMVSKITSPVSPEARVGAPHDPDTIRRLGYRIVDIIADELADTSRRPVNPPPRAPAAMEDLFGGTLPAAPTDPGELLDIVRDQVLPSTANYNHPKLICYVSSSTTPVAGMLESLVSTLRLFPYTWAMTPACTHIETTVVRWLGQMVGFSDNAAGYMTTGGSWANLMGLAAARTRQSEWKVTEEGLAGHPAQTVYVSEEGHSCLDQCMRLMGLGARQLRRIPVDEHFRIRLDALEAAINADKASGKQPMCVIGVAGATNTGAVDPLDALADLAERHGLWFHIDGAYGAFAHLAPEAQPLLSGLERADSVVCDPHKWLNIPYEAGCILVKRWDDLANTFSLIPPYLEAGHEVEEHNHWHHGFELTRGDRALKVWFALRQYGVDAYRHMVSEHIRMARYLAELVRQADDFELVLEPALSVCCFRYVPSDLDQSDPNVEGYLNTLNRELELALIDNGGASVSGTTINDKRVLRACIVNHRVTTKGVEETLELLRELGAELHRQSRAN